MGPLYCGVQRESLRGCLRISRESQALSKQSLALQIVYNTLQMISGTLQRVWRLSRECQRLSGEPETSTERESVDVSGSRERVSRAITLQIVSNTLQIVSSTLQIISSTFQRVWRLSGECQRLWRPRDIHGKRLSVDVSDISTRESLLESLALARQFLSLSIQSLALHIIVSSTLQSRETIWRVLETLRRHRDIHGERLTLNTTHRVI